MESLFRGLRKMGAPPIFSKEVMGELAEPPQFKTKASFPDATFTRALIDQTGQQLPQAIAHRGFKAKHPENTMAAFKAAVEVGVNALETDVHLTKDGEVVLSHDATLQRCFGVDKKLRDCEWKFVRDLRTVKAPHEPMPRLQDLLEYLAQPELSSVWLLLDIKVDNNPETIMRGMAEAVRRVPSPPDAPWQNRILLGFWAAKFVPLCHDLFPGFPIANIGFSVPYSRQFLAVPHVSFNMLQASLVSPSGRRFIAQAKALDRAVYSWTVNDTTNMDWCIRQGLDGVITDDPEKYINYCKSFDPEDKIPEWSWPTIVNLIRINIFAWLFGVVFGRKHGFKLDQRFLVNTTSRL